MPVDPGICGVSDNCKQPGPAISPSKPAISLKRSQVCLLDNILRILVMLDDPTRKIVCGIQERQENLFEPAPFVSH
jgi:hypothetical protein